MNIGSLEKEIFQKHSEKEFEQLCLEIFRLQAEHNRVYKAFIENLGVAPQGIKKLSGIPFLPIQFFKSHKVTTGEWKEEIVFSSSATTGSVTSKHYVKSKGIYVKSFTEGFRHFYGSHLDYTFLALLPSYLEREGSSLIFMMEQFVEDTIQKGSGFFLTAKEGLFARLDQLDKERKKIILFGVTFALLDLAETHAQKLPAGVVVMETGGMKGRRKEMIREELHHKLEESFGVPSIYSEYGMTELLSQAYSKGDGVFECPPWMKILIRDIYDPLTLQETGQRGGINVIDLANLYSCSFIATQDIGILRDGGSFLVLGRFDHSDIRGCNLLIA